MSSVQNNPSSTQYSFWQNLEEMKKQESMPCYQYCAEKTKATAGDVFKQCVVDCQWVQRESRFSRLP